MFKKPQHHPFIPKDILQVAPDLYEYYHNYASTSFTSFKFNNENLIILSDAYENLEMYSEKHKLSFDEISILLMEGYLDGKNKLNAEINERTKYGFNEVKSYLINQIKNRNKGNFSCLIDYQIGYDTEHDPDKIREIGFENAKFYEAWKEVFKMPDLYNDTFIEINIEKYKEESNDPIKARFPRRFVIDPSWPASMQCALDVNENCMILTNLFVKRQIAFVIEPNGKRVQGLRMRPVFRMDFNKICIEFSKEAANNNEKGLIKKNKNFYFETVTIAEKLIAFVKQPKQRESIISIINTINPDNTDLFEQLFSDLDMTINHFKQTYPFIFNSIDLGKTNDNLNLPVTEKNDGDISKPLKEELPDKVNEVIPLYLSDVFESDDNYNKIMEILVKEEKCDPNTHIWIDQDKGNRRYLPALIKYLHSQGYYKNGQLTNNQVLDIIKNTFKWNIGIDSVKKAKPKNYVFKFIPTASKLNLK